LRGIVEVVIAGKALEAEDDVGLFQIFGGGHVTTGVGGLFRCRGCGFWQVGEVGFGQFDQRIMGDVSGCGNDHVVRGVVGVDEILQGGFFHVFDDVDFTKNGGAHHLIVVGALHALVEDEVIGRVVVHADFLNDNLAFALDFSVGQGGVLNHVAEDFCSEGDVVF